VNNEIDEIGFFACGTLSDKKGFEYVELGPSKLPGIPTKYLDCGEIPRENVSYDVKHVTSNQKKFVIFSRRQPINPNDSQTNRGSFLSVGVILSSKIPFHAVANCINLVSEIIGNLHSNLTPENSFKKDFHLSNFKYTPPITTEKIMHQCSPLLLSDFILQAVNHTGYFESKDSIQPLLASDFPLEKSLDKLIYSHDSAQVATHVMDIDRAKINQLAKITLDGAAIAANELEKLIRIQEYFDRELSSITCRSDNSKTLLTQLSQKSKAIKDIGDRTKSHSEYETEASTTFETIQPISMQPRSFDSQQHPQRNRNHKVQKIKSRATSHKIIIIFLGVMLLILMIVSLSRFFLSDDNFMDVSGINTIMRGTDISDENNVNTSKPATSNVARERALLENVSE